MKVVKFFQTVFAEWNNDKVGRLAASLSYYTVFSLAPLLVVIIAVAGLFFGADVAQQQIVGQIQSLVGAEGAQPIDSLLTNARRLDAGILTTVIAIGAIVLGATGVDGSGMQPTADAMPLSDAAKVEQGTRAPTNATQTPVPAALAATENPPRETSVYVEAEGDAFNPIRLVGAAIGVRLCGWLNNVLEITQPKSY